MTRTLRLACLSLLALLPACRSTGPGEASRARLLAEVETTLEAFHRAASEADGDAYFELMAGDLVYLGTDRTERWSREEFRAWAEPYFGSGRGWTYVTRSRHVALGPHGRIAWFDEELDNASYGACRGTGVLRRLEQGRWELVQYNLALPVPNELARDLVERIRGLDAHPPESPESGSEGS